MSLLISAEEISKSFGSQELFHDLSLSILKRDRVGLIGPNGSGKSTLLKILAGIELPDTGKVAVQRGLRIGYVPQESLFADKPIKTIVEEAITHPGWDLHEKEVQAEIVLSKIGFTDADQKATALSGGWKKRLEIAKQLVNAPDLLLLDEPTNHLDLEGVLWLENFLLKQNLTYVVISHDRYFLENTTSRMVEIDRSYPKGLFCADGSYNTFLERREAFLAGQIEQEKSLASKVRREEEWLKQNPKARTTKSKSRIQEAGRLQQELAEIKNRNNQSSNVTEFDFSSTARETKKLLVATNISKSMNGRRLFKNVDIVLTPGLKLGIIGANGSGKSTFLKILAGQLEPDLGTIKMPSDIKVLIFDQNREQLPPDITLREALSPEGDRIIYRNQPIHINSWCKRFLFAPSYLDMSIKYLSGGEKARILIARLMAKPADILLLDEPTNDLDIATLETLEDSLKDFPGAIVMITHDRYLLEKTCNLLLGIAENGETALVADYSQWETFRKQNLAVEPTSKAKVQETIKTPSNNPSPLTHLEKKEWEQMEKKILAAEEEVKKRDAELLNTDATDIDKLQEACNQLHKAQETLDKLYARWQELDDKQK